MEETKQANVQLTHCNLDNKNNKFTFEVVNVIKKCRNIDIILKWKRKR